jgi:hypothetical protein
LAKAKGRTRLAITAFVVAILFVSVIAVTILYHNADITNQKREKTPNLEASLDIVEIQGKNSNFLGKSTPIPYNYLYITGIVNNSGKETAYHAGLIVLGYDTNDELTLNITVPLTLRGIFGSDNATNDFVLKNYRTSNQTLLREVFEVNYSSYVTISILHEGTINNWTVTPVWTNSP